MSCDLLWIHDNEVHFEKKNIRKEVKDNAFHFYK